jgi:hypothetical protein
LFTSLSSLLLFFYSMHENKTVKMPYENK